MNEQERQIMSIISGSGDSKAKAFAALKKVKESDYEGARELLAEAKQADLQAHQTQTELIQAELGEGEEKPIINLLMVHAQDHYMTSQLARDLIETLIDIFENKEEK